MNCQKCFRTFPKNHRDVDLCLKCTHQLEKLTGRFIKKGSTTYNNIYNKFIATPIADGVPKPLVKVSNDLLDWLDNL